MKARPSRKALERLFIFGDWIAFGVAWLLFFAWRKFVEMQDATWELVLGDNRLFLGLIVIPGFWILSLKCYGGYDKILFRSRLKVLAESIEVIIVGTLVLLFGAVRDDLTLQYVDYAEIYLVLAGIHIGVVVLFRLFTLSRIKAYYHRGELVLKRVATGDVGVDLPQVSLAEMSRDLEAMGSVNIDECYIAGGRDMNKIMAFVHGHLPQVQLKISSSEINNLPHYVSINPSLKSAFYDVDFGRLSFLSRLIKRVGDILAAVVGLIVLFPLGMYAVVRIKLDSPGSVFFKQERIGRHGQVFNIIKFRSMYANAEDAGVQLSHLNDTRVTPWGRVMRKWRIDELPQLWLVLIGRMSIVGPRPERRFYLDQIVESLPEYNFLFSLLPGITSWGQMRCGYASDLDQLLTRARYDLLYFQYQSVVLDLKIILMTLHRLVTGRIS